MLQGQGVAISALLPDPGGPSICGTESQSLSWVLPPTVQEGQAAPAPCVRAGSGSTPAFSNSPSGPKAEFQAQWMESLCARLRLKHECPSLVCAPCGSSLCHITLQSFSFLSLFLFTLILHLFFSLSNEKNSGKSEKPQVSRTSKRYQQHVSFASL